MQRYIGMQLGPYQIVEQVGRGGMATVFKAYQPAMDRYVAIKVLPDHFTEDESFVGRFNQEARTLARLQHPHILPVHDYGEQQGLTYLVMRYVEAGTLKDLIAREGPMELHKAARILGQVGRALDYGHSQGVVHRDIKPSNVLIDPQGNTFLTDFGIAKLVAETAQFTASGAIVGTPAYMSPEQGMGRPVDSRCDIYSLGVVLYELVTGRVPFEADTPLAVMLKHINEPLPLPRQIKPDLPLSVERVILKAMAKEPADRFQSAQEMVDALTRAVTSLPTEAITPPPLAETVKENIPENIPESMPERSISPPPGPAVPAVEPAPPGRRVRWPLLAGAALLLGLVLLAGALLVLRNRPAGGPAQVQGPPGWTSYRNMNFVSALAQQGDILWAGGEGGLVRWDLTDGSHSRLGREDGFAANRINDLLVDGDGVLWLATDAGVNRYDGERVITFDEVDGLDASWIQTLFLDQAGGLWAGSHGGERGLNYYDGRRWGPPPVPPLPVEFPNVQVVAGVGADGLVVGLEGHGLAIFDGQNWQQLAGGDGMPGDTVLDVLLTDDSLWTSFDAGVVRFDLAPGRLEPRDMELMPHDSIHTLHQAADGAIWLGGEWRALRFDPASGDWQEFDTEPGPIPGRGVTDIEEDEHGLWLGTYGGGTVLYDGQRWETWAVDEQLGGNRIEAIRQDQDGTLWFLHPGTGLSRYEPPSDNWQVFGEAEGAPSWPAVPAIDSEGNLWTGDYGALVRYDGARWQRLASPELADTEIYAVEMGPDDVQWLVTDRGLLRHDPATDGWTTFTAADHPLIGEIWSILAASDGSLWLGGEAGLARYDGAAWRTPSAAGDPPRLVDDLAEAPDGSLWIVADGELVHRADGEWQYFAWPGEGWLQRVTVAPDGRVWAGHDALGRYDPASGEWQIWTPEDGLVNWTVLSVHVTPEGVVWVGTEGGVSRYVPPD